VTRRARARTGEDQLFLDLEAREHPAVECARAVRAKAGLPPSLTSPEVLTRVRAILDTAKVGRRALPTKRAS
jgi:hypothetical protein